MHRKQQKCMHAAKTTMNLLKCSRGQATSLHDCCCKATGQWPCGQRGGRARTCRIPEVAQVGAPPLQLSHAVRQLTAHIRIQLPRAQAPSAYAAPPATARRCCWPGPWALACPGAAPAALPPLYQPRALARAGWCAAACGWRAAWSRCSTGAPCTKWNKALQYASHHHNPSFSPV